MTIQRKNLLSSGPLLGVYAFMLVFGFAAISYELVRVGWPLFLAANTLGNAAAILRLSGSWLGGQKYLMWALVGVFVHVMRGTFATSDSPHFREWLVPFVATYAAVGVLGYRKISGRYYAKSDKGGWSGNGAKVQ